MIYLPKIYEIRFVGTKTVVKYDPKTDFKGSPKIVDEWSDTDELHSRPSSSNMLAPFTSFLYPKSGMTVHHLMHLPNQPGHFVAQQTENSRGMYDKKGQFLASYYVEVSYRIVEPMQPFDDTMNLPTAEIE